MRITVIIFCAMVSTGLSSVCDSNWQYFKGKCYYVYEHQYYNYNTAVSVCEGMGGNLAIIDNVEEHNFVNGYSRGQVDLWIGLTDLEHEGVWKWVDESSVTYSIWNGNEPNNDDGIEHCVYMQGSRHGGWSDGSCIRRKGFVCERELVCRILPVGIENGDIPDAQMTASSSYNDHHAPNQGRLNYIKLSNSYASAWCAAVKEVGEWLQVDLGSNRMVTRVATQGRGDDAYPQRVTGYKLRYNNSVAWRYVKDCDGNDKVFTGNSDHVSIVYHDLGTDSFVARYVRFEVQSWFGHPSMRMEVYTCE